MVDIHSANAEIRRGIKKEEEETGQKYNVRICYATQGGHNNHQRSGPTPSLRRKFWGKPALEDEQDLWNRWVL